MLGIIHNYRWISQQGFFNYLASKWRVFMLRIDQLGISASKMVKFWSFKTADINKQVKKAEPLISRRL